MQVYFTMRSATQLLGAAILLGCMIAPGASLWRFQTGQNIRASRVPYAINVGQYVAIAPGSDIVSFVLPQEKISVKSN
jgi:hypothetical protein